MTDWTAGYVADIGYTYGYYTELNPQRIKLAFLHAGLTPPDVGAACELGFGQGISVNIHAAAAATRWHGTDFNPAQASFAQSLASACGASAQLHDEAFAEFAQRPDLPDFDYIGLHGIWSWISDQNRAVIVDFVRRKLKVGGVLYISYNTQPGWAAFVPLRQLMAEHANTLSPAGNSTIQRVDAAVDFVDRLLQTQPLFARTNPQAAERIQAIKGQNRHYLAHEYFNRDWQPMHFASMADWLAPAKLQFACSADYLDQIDAIHLTADQQQFLNDIPDAQFRQNVRDFMINRQFRKDYWVKGARRLSPLEQAEAMRQQKVQLATPREDIPLKVAGALGEADMNASVYGPILDLLADYKARTLGQIEQATGVKFSNLVQTVLLLTGGGHLVHVQSEDAINRARKHTERLNAHLIQKARSHTELSYLASPVSGGGIMVNRFYQLFLLALSQSRKQPADWAQFAWQILSVQNQKLVREGVTLDSPEDNLAELTRLAHTFASRHLPILKALQVV